MKELSAEDKAPELVYKTNSNSLEKSDKSKKNKGDGSSDSSAESA